jgi:hypothetical protein
VISIRTLARAEQAATRYRAESPASPGDARDYAIGVHGITSTGDYLLTIGPLRTGRTANAADILFHRFLSVPDRIRYVLTTVNTKPWDVRAWGRERLPEGMVVVDAACVLAARGATCDGEITFSTAGNLPVEGTTGFAVPEADGVWSDGPAASFTCKLPGEAKPRPSKVRIASSAFVLGDHRQRMLVSINRGPAHEFRYDDPSLKAIELDLPASDAPGLELHFAFPDAVSPQEMGLNTDDRKLGVKIRSIRFE